MSSFEHSRTKIFNVGQHPYKHDGQDIAYFNPAAGGSVSNIQQAMDWLFAVLYPNQMPQVATPGDLPLVGNSINDTRVVADDGDGNSASYRWFQIDGELSPSWHKIYDMDWSSDSILASWQDQTQALYVFKYGKDDVDNLGAVITGDLAGQSIYGGLSANTNLTLFANNGDGAGPATGFIQAGDNVRPLVDDAFTLGTATKRWADIYSVFGFIGDITITDGSITSSGGVIDFGTADFTGIDSITAGSITAMGGISSLAAGSTIGDVTIGDGSITSLSGAIDFDDEDLLTTGFASIGQILISDDTISSSTSSIDFLLNDLINIDLIDAQTVVGDIGRFGGGTDFVEIGSGSIDYANGTVLDLSSVGGFLVSSTTGVFTSEVDIIGQGDISADGMVTAGSELRILSGLNQFTISQNASDFDVDSTGYLNINSLGTAFGSDVYPTVSGASDLGKTTAYWGELWLNGSIYTSGGVELTNAVLKGLRKNIFRGDTSPAQDGDSLFWSNADQCWYADHPDSEILHSEISGLLDDDHTQYACLNGRGGGQWLKGATTANQDLVLDSTSHASKGLVKFMSNLAGGTSGTYDVGTDTLRFRNFYSSGEFYGLRPENQLSIGEPSASISNIGRLYFNKTTNRLRVDIGGTWKDVGGVDKTVVQDTVNWDGIITSFTYNVSATTSDASKCLWSFRVAGTAEQLYPRITATTTTVTVTFTIPPVAGSYNLVGVG